MTTQITSRRESFRLQFLRLALLSLAAMVGILPLAGGAPVAPARASNSDCTRLPLQPQPSWLFSGEWINDGTELVLPDTMGGRLLRYRRSGQHLRAIAVSSRNSQTFTRPHAINSGERGLVVLDIDRLVVLGQNLEPAWDVLLSDVRLPGGDRIEAFLSFLGSGRDFLGFTMLVDGKTREKWWGITRLRLGKSPEVERLHELPSMMGEDGSFYLTHEGPYLANAGAATYALFFGQKPHIRQLLPTRRKLVAFPAGHTSPRLGWNTRENTEPSFRAWEASTAPVALFGRGRFLYLLARQPRPDGQTQWSLYQIDPERDRMIRSIDLPTRARHLVVVPGPREWAIVEKGSVVETGQQFQHPIESILFIRSSAIENARPGTPLSKCISPRQ